MSKEMNEHYYRVNSFGFKDREYLYEYRDRYIDVEKKLVKQMAEKYDVFYYDLVSGLNSVGFMRLTHYHWASLIKRAEDLISQQTCSQVKINFICHSDEEDVRGGTLGDQVYQKRFFQSKFEHLPSIDKELIIDGEGSSALYKDQICVASKTGQSIYSVPRQSNESHIINQQVLNQYRRGACGEFLSRVSSKYKDDIKLLDRADIFRKENYNEGYTPYGSYPAHPHSTMQ